MIIKNMGEVFPMKHPKKQRTMKMKVTIINAWLLSMYVICGIGLWIYTINVPLGCIIFICVAISLLFWVIYTVKNWRCPHCGRDMPGVYYCKYCGKSLDE